LEHKDTLGKSSIIRPGEIQLMSAGAGIQHSEFNHYPDRNCSFFQIWIEPKEKNTKPKYEQRAYLDNKKVNGLTLLASSKEEGRGVVAINADASVYLGEWIEQNEISLPLDSGRSYWLQMIDGSIRVKADAVLNRGDGAAIKNQESFIGFALENSRILLFSLP
ncbi:MAG: pirin family protein, partial [Bacteriovoracaceae bacterium]